MLISINGASGRCSLFASDICVLKTTRTSARTWFTPPYNSPFRPFLLTSTSTGQEGLDFYPWCHRLVHWNLPGNPVDLEQREGHVHWYKGHAVRRIVLAVLATVADAKRSEDERRRVKVTREREAEAQKRR